MKFEIERYLKEASGSVKRLELLQAMRVIIQDQTLTDRKLRKTVEEMIIQDGFLIRSSEEGYSIIKTEDELIDAMEYIRAKAYPLLERANCLEKNFYKNNRGQMSLHLL